LVDGWDSNNDLDDKPGEEQDVRLTKESTDEDKSVQTLTTVKDVSNVELEEGLEDYLLNTGLRANVLHSQAGFCNIQHLRRTVKFGTGHLTKAESEGDLILESDYRKKFKSMTACWKFQASKH
jgi:hypothetical protein